jgi:hypothetical protein
MSSIRQALIAETGNAMQAYQRNTQASTTPWARR